MVDATSSRARCAGWRVWAAPASAAGPPSGRAGKAGTASSGRRHKRRLGRPTTRAVRFATSGLADATGIGSALPPRPRAASPRPETSDLVASTIKEETMEKTFQTPTPVTVRVRVPAGEVVLDTVDGDQTSVELEPLNEEAVRAVEEATVELRGSTLEIEVRESRGWRSSGGSPEVSLRVRTPHGANVDLRAASADVAGRGRFG